MTEQEALELVRAQGHTAGVPDHDAGTVRVWVHGSDHYIDVKLGRDLIYLAEGKITIEDLETGRAAAAGG